MVKDKRDVVLRAEFSADVAAVTALRRLRETVFGKRRIAVFPNDRPVWQPIGLFEADGTCVAGIDVAAIPLIVNMMPMSIGGLRDVAVLEAWRGHGLFRRLMEAATDWYEANSLDLVLLYTEEPALYTRFGFTPVAQHAFEGRAPAAMSSVPARTIDPIAEAALVGRLLADRAPVSSRIALGAAPALFRDFALAADGETFAYSSTLDALIVHEEDGDTLVVVDIVAAVMPSLAAVIGALGRAPERVRTLFAPDQLEWHGTPRLDDTGLMARGPSPAAMRGPFMLPPTAAF